MVRVNQWARGEVLAGTGLGVLGVLFIQCSTAPQHFLYFLPLPHGQDSLRPIFSLLTGCRVSIRGSDNTAS